MLLVIEPAIPVICIGNVPAAVVSVVVMVRADLPEAFAIDGELNEHVAPIGRPTQDNATLELNPKFERTFMVDVAELPAVTGEGEGLVAYNSKLGGVVLSTTATPDTDPLLENVGPGAMMSGRPSPFISAIRAFIGSRPFPEKRVMGGSKVPSPFPNWTAFPCGVPSDGLSVCTNRSCFPSPFRSPSATITSLDSGGRRVNVPSPFPKATCPKEIGGCPKEIKSALLSLFKSAVNAAAKPLRLAGKMAF